MRNAILLAAGFGSRLKPLTLTTHKSQTKINGIPMIERQIEFLQARGVEEIIIVTGYLHETFNYLTEKYDGLRLVHNDKFAEYNNIYSMYLVKEHLGDSFVINSDTYFHNNFIPRVINRSTYFSLHREGACNEEWVPEYDQITKKISHVDIVKNDRIDGVILGNISYWTKADAVILKQGLEDALKNRDFTNLHWDQIPIENLDLIDVYVEEVHEHDMFEIDTVEELEALEVLLEKL